MFSGRPETLLWLTILAGAEKKRKMPLFGKKDSGKKVRKDGHKDIDKQIINIEDKYHLRQVLGKWVSNLWCRLGGDCFPPSKTTSFDILFSCSPTPSSSLLVISHPPKFGSHVSFPSSLLLCSSRVNQNVIHSYYPSFDGTRKKKLFEHSTETAHKTRERVKELWKFFFITQHTSLHIFCLLSAIDIRQTHTFYDKA